MSRVSCYKSAIRSAGAMSKAQSVLALTVLALLMSSASALSPLGRTSDPCVPDIIGEAEAEAYETEHPICSRLAEKTQKRTIPDAAVKYWPYEDFQKFPKKRCAMRRRPMNITLLWSNDPSRAASTLLAVLLRHVYKFQRVHLAFEGTHSPQLHKRDELIINLAAVVRDDSAKAIKRLKRNGLTAFSLYVVPMRRRLHAWLTPAARSIVACQNTNWTFYSNMTALAMCSFRVATHYSFAATIDAPVIFGVGDDCNATMQKLQQRTDAAFIPTRAAFVNRSVFNRNLLTSNHSFLFLDFDMWSEVPGVSVLEPPPCVSDRDDGLCKPKLDDSTGMLVTDSLMLKDNARLFSLVLDFKPTSESLRMLLEQEAHGVNLEEAACELADRIKSDVMDEMFMKVTPTPWKPPNPKTYDKRVPKKYTVATFLCIGDPDNNSYDLIISSAGIRVFRENPKLLDIRFIRYFVNCSDYKMSTSLVDLMETSDAPNILGVVSLTVEGVPAASAVAAAHRVPLLLAHVVPDEHVTGNTTWQTAGRLRHIMLALQHFIKESGWTHVAVLSQPTIFARHYFAALQDKAKFFLRDFEIPFDLTERSAKEALRDVRDTNTRVVVVNTDSDAATLILAAAVELNMSYTDGFVWIVREPRDRLECSTTHFTVSLSKVKEDKPWEQQIRGVVEVGQLWPPHSVPLGDALMTVSRGFNNVFQQRPDLLTDLHSHQVIRAFDDSLKDTPVAGFNGVQLNYKERMLEEAFVYLDELCNNKFKHRRLAMWLVNATSGSVRTEYGSHVSLRFGLGVKRDVGVNVTAYGVCTDADSCKQHRIVSDKPTNTSNSVILVHQWAFDDSLKDTPVAGFNGVQLNYKERMLEEAFVYLDELCNNKFKHRRLAMWLVNATSGSVRTEYGSHVSLRFGLGVKRDVGVNVTAYGVCTDADSCKQHRIVSDKPTNTSNSVILVHQWSESITKIETPISGVSLSDILNSNKINQLNSNNLNVLRTN